MPLKSASGSPVVGFLAGHGSSVGKPSPKAHQGSRRAQTEMLGRRSKPGKGERQARFPPLVELPLLPPLPRLCRL